MTRQHLLDIYLAGMNIALKVLIDNNEELWICVTNAFVKLLPNVGGINILENLGRFEETSSRRLALIFYATCGLRNAICA